MRGFTSSSNHSSSTWCRKTFESIGEITPPCGVPLVPKCRSPFSSTPALSHLSIMRRITPSVTRWSRKARSLSWGMESKKVVTHNPSPRHLPIGDEKTRAASVRRPRNAGDEHDQARWRSAAAHRASRWQPIAHSRKLDKLGSVGCRRQIRIRRHQSRALPGIVDELAPCTKPRGRSPRPLSDSAAGISGQRGELPCN